MRRLSHPRFIVRPLMAVGMALAAAGLASTGLASPAAAQGRGGYTDGRSDGGYDAGGYGRAPGGARPLYEWTGRVDREVYIVMQSGDVRTRIDGYDNGAGGRVRVSSALPQTDGVIDVRMAEGRGRVDVVEQPTSRNGYRAVVRVRDDDAGSGYYRLVALWRPTGGDRAGYDGRGDRGDGRYGDGRSGDGSFGGHPNGGDANSGYPNSGYPNSGGYNAGTYAGSGVLHWRGRVDDVEEIRVQGARVDTRTVSGQGAADVRSQFAGGALPARDVTVRVNDRSGRGRVMVVQQPRAWNGYTAVVRVEDRDAGAGWHDFDVSW